MNAPVEYYTAETLGAAAGVSSRTFRAHLKADVGELTQAREVVPGLGVRFAGERCAKYLSLCHASPRCRRKAKLNPFT